MRRKRRRYKKVQTPQVKARECVETKEGNPSGEGAGGWGGKRRYKKSEEDATPRHVGDRESTCQRNRYLQERERRPSRTPATTVAHAPVPHASVRPAPRSHTTILTCPGSNTCTVDKLLSCFNSQILSPSCLKAVVILRPGVAHVPGGHEPSTSMYLIGLGTSAWPVVAKSPHPTCTSLNPPTVRGPMMAMSQVPHMYLK
jgi:hypothetical protein